MFYLQKTLILIRAVDCINDSNNTDFDLFVFDNNFWRVRKQMNQKGEKNVYLDPSNTQALNPSEQFLEPKDDLKGNYSFAFYASVENDLPRFF